MTMIGASVHITNSVKHPRKREGCHQVSIVVTINDKGRTIGEDHTNAKYTDDEVQKVIELRKYGYTYLQISQIMDMPIRTIRDYVTGRRRCQSVAGWGKVVRYIQD